MVRAPLDGAWDSYKSVSLGGCIRLDANFANAGSGGDKDGDMERSVDPKVVKVFLSLPQSIWLELRENADQHFRLATCAVLV